MKPEGLRLQSVSNVVRTKHYRVRSPRAVTLLGGGQVDEIAEMGKKLEIDLLIVDAGLTAIQQRNLEEKTGLKTIDRTGLILEIFGERAATAEGRLQVELAHLDYQAGRLVRSWTHLERQRGGFGFLGGPGETQIEADRRMIRDRMARLRRELRGGKAHPVAPPRPPQTRALAGYCAGRLYQCGQIDIVQPADRGDGAGRRHAVRNARSDDAADIAAGRRKGDFVRHRWLCLRFADAVGCGVSRYVGRGDFGRHHRPCPRYRAPRERCAARRCAGDLARSWGWHWTRSRAQSGNDRALEQD